MAGGLLDSGVFKQGGANSPLWMNNIAIVRATTTNAGDSIKITSADGTALTTSNYGWITLPGTTAGQLARFSVTADVTILLTGAHWGIGTTGDITGGILRVMAINDNGTLRWGVALLGGRNTFLTTDTNATQTNITTPEGVLCNVAIGSATNRCREVGWFRANFDDTGGAAEDLWAIQTGINDVVTGESADGYWKPWNPTFPSGFSVAPTVTQARWTQINRVVFLDFKTNADGTSNDTVFTQTAPAKSLNLTRGLTHLVVNNGSGTTTPGVVGTAVGSLTLTLFRDTSGAVWTNANAKSANFTHNYEVGPAASFIE